MPESVAVSYPVVDERNDRISNEVLQKGHVAVFTTECPGVRLNGSARTRADPHAEHSKPCNSRGGSLRRVQRGFAVVALHVDAGPKPAPEVGRRLRMTS